MFLLKNPPDSIIYLNSIGRIFIIILNFFTIILFNRFYSKNIFIDNGEKQDDKNKDLNFGDSKHVWPKQSLKYFESSSKQLDKGFIDLIQKNYNYNIKLISSEKDFEDSEWWKKCREEYQHEFLKNEKLNLLALENFRSKTKTSSAIISDLSYLKSSVNRIDKIKSLSLINLYHKLSEYLDLEILRLVSESYVGKNICLNYRDQRLSHTLLRHAYFSSQILKFTKLNPEENNIIVDIGGGYGSLIRILKHIFKKSTFIIFEIPEACILATYFLKKNFPNCKIGQALDFEDVNLIDSKQAKIYDFIVLPQPKIKLVADNLTDLTINTISMGEMTNKTQNFYLNNIERITKKYFYSVNRPNPRTEKYNAQGFYNWNFQKRWNTKLYNYSHTYHIEFLGKKSFD